MKKLIFLLIPMLLQINLSAKEVGNGAGAEVCENSVKLYDFLEGSFPKPFGYGIDIWQRDSNINRDSYLDKALARILDKVPEMYPILRDQVQAILEVPKDKLFFDIEIPRIFKDDIPFVSSNCEYKNVANWNDDQDFLFIVSRYYDKMDSMDQAGLIFHEAVYRVMRIFWQVENSNLARKFVAQVFSDSEIETDFLDIATGISKLYVPQDTDTCALTVNIKKPKKIEGKLNLDLWDEPGTHKSIYKQKIKSNENIFTTSIDCSDLIKSKNLSLTFIYLYKAIISSSVEFEEGLSLEVTFNKSSLQSPYLIRQSKEQLSGMSVYRPHTYFHSFSIISKKDLVVNSKFR